MPVGSSPVQLTSGPTFDIQFSSLNFTLKFFERRGVPRSLLCRRLREKEKKAKKERESQPTKTSAKEARVPRSDPFSLP